MCILLLSIELLNYTLLSSIEYYFQERRRVARAGEPAKSTTYLKPKDAPLTKNLSNPRDAEVAAVRRK